MSRRKGEIGNGAIDRGWPHQVAIPASLTTGKVHEALLLFCKDLSLSPLGHTFVRDGQYVNCWCFAERDDAEKFRARFGGEFLDPKDRPKWPG